MNANPPLRHAGPAISVDQLLANALDGVFLIDRRRRCVLFNEAMERITGFQGSEIADAECPCFEVLACRDEQGRPLSNTLCPTKSLFDGTRQSARQRLLIRRKNGSQCWIETIYTTVTNGSSEPAYVLAVVRDISETKTKEQELRQELASLARQVQTRPTENRGVHAPAGSLRTPAAATTGTAAGATNAAAGTTADAATGAAAGTTAVGSSCASADPADNRTRCCTGTSDRHGSNAGGADAPESATAYKLDPLIADFERKAILRALKAAAWQRNKAARLMGISRSRLYRRMEALKIDLRQLD